MSELEVPVTQRDPFSALQARGSRWSSTVTMNARTAAVHMQSSDHFARELRFVFRHFPLTQVHPNAETAADSAELAGASGKFWEMHGGIYQSQDQLGLPLLFALAAALGLPQPELQDALATGAYKPKARTDVLGGVRSGVNGAPTFFINGERHDGSYEFVALIAASRRGFTRERHCDMPPSSIERTREGARSPAS